MGIKIIFIGGLADGDTKNLFDVKESFVNSNSDLDVQYYSHKDTDKIIKYIDANSDTRFSIVGHSYGGDTAMEIVNKRPGRVSVLLTLDPEGSGGRRFLSNVGQHVETWINVNATGGHSLDGDNVVSGLGDLWGGGPYRRLPSSIPSFI
jgi:pimeloyl-ACP methyl ester carboxylesterase